MRLALVSSILLAFLTIMLLATSCLNALAAGPKLDGTSWSTPYNDRGATKILSFKSADGGTAEYVVSVSFDGKGISFEERGWYSGASLKATLNGDRITITDIGETMKGSIKGETMTLNGETYTRQP